MRPHGFVADPHEYLDLLEFITLDVAQVEDGALFLAEQLQEVLQLPGLFFVHDLLPYIGSIYLIFPIALIQLFRSFLFQQVETGITYCLHHIRFGIAGAGCAIAFP